jgi:hypothetical protein
MHSPFANDGCEQGIALKDPHDCNPKPKVPSMTNERVSDFASELVQMAMATQRVPKLEADLAAVQRDNSDLYDTVQRLELRLLDRNTEIDRLNATIRQLEVSRDDAELRFLECDDAKSTLARTLEGFRQEIAGVLQAIAPIPEPQPVTVVPEAMPLVDGSLSSPFATIDDPVQFSGSSSSADTTTSEPETGQSESPLPVAIHPTSEDTVATEASSASAPSIATPSADATSPSDPEPKKYLWSEQSWMYELDPVWIDWFNRQSPTGQ